MAHTSSLSTSAFRLGMIALCVTCLAAEHNHRLDVGDSGPTWKDVPGTDDQLHQLDDYKDKKLVVAVFTCNSCPVAVDYEDRLIALQEEYADKGVQLVAINVNTNEANNLEAMKERATAKKFNFPYLFDATQQSARAYGATVTPHAFVLDEDRKVAYMGAIDDHRSESKVSKTHLRDALDALLDGETPAVSETRQFGCGIKYDN